MHAVLDDRRAAEETIALVDGAAVSEDVPFQGRRIRWRQFGDSGDAPLVLLHGGHGSWMHWIRNVQALARAHRVLVPDMPGFNDSDAIEPAHGAQDRLAETLAALTSTLGRLIGEDAPFDLAGFSFGGLVAARLAAETGRVRRLALLGPAGHGMPRRQTSALRDWRFEDPAEAAAALRHNLSAFMLHGPASLDALAFAIHEQSCRRTRFRSKAMSRAGGLLSLLDRVDRPMLMLWGEHDVTAVPADVGEALRGSRPERDWCVLPGAGHWVQFERADEVNRLLQSWFANA